MPNNNSPNQPGSGQQPQQQSSQQQSNPVPSVGLDPSPNPQVVVKSVNPPITPDQVVSMAEAPSAVQLPEIKLQNIKIPPVKNKTVQGHLKAIEAKMIATEKLMKDIVKLQKVQIRTEKELHHRRRELYQNTFEEYLLDKTIDFEDPDDPDCTCINLPKKPPGGAPFGGGRRRRNPSRSPGKVPALAPPLNQPVTKPVDPKEKVPGQQPGLPGLEPLQKPLPRQRPWWENLPPFVPPVLPDFEGPVFGSALNDPLVASQPSSIFERELADVIQPQTPALAFTNPTPLSFAESVAQLDREILGGQSGYGGSFNTDPDAVPAGINLTPEQYKLAQKGRTQISKGAEPAFLSSSYSTLTDFFNKSLKSRKDGGDAFEFPLSGAVETPDGGILTVNPIGPPWNRRPEFNYKDGITWAKAKADLAVAARYAELFAAVTTVLNSVAGVKLPIKVNKQFFKTPVYQNGKPVPLATPKPSGVVPKSDIKPVVRATPQPEPVPAAAAEPVSGMTARQRALTRGGSKGDTGSRAGSLTQRRKTTKERINQDLRRTDTAADDIAIQAELSSRTTAQGQAAQRDALREIERTTSTGEQIFQRGNLNANEATMLYKASGGINDLNLYSAESQEYFRNLSSKMEIPKFAGGGIFDWIKSKLSPQGLARGLKGVRAGFTGMNAQGFGAMMRGEGYKASSKPQILGRGAYSAPTLRGAQRYAGATGSLGGVQTPGGVVNSIVPGNAPRINFIEPQSKVSPDIFNKGRDLATKLQQGAYPNSARANMLRGQITAGSALPKSNVKPGHPSMMLLQLIADELINPRSTAVYDQISGPNAYYNAPGYKGPKPSGALENAQDNMRSGSNNSKPEIVPLPPDYIKLPSRSKKKEEVGEEVPGIDMPSSIFSRSSTYLD